MKYVKTYENYMGRKAVNFVKKSTGRNIEHYNRSVEYVANAIENGDIEATVEEVEEILKSMGGMRVPFTNNKMDNKFGEKGFKHVVKDFAKSVLADALELTVVQDEDDEFYDDIQENKKINNKMGKLKHIKLFEDIYDFMNDGGEEDDYLETPEYFVETYFNGATSQLGEMLAMFREQGRMEELINYINHEMTDSGSMTKEDLKNWMLKN